MLCIYFKTSYVTVNPKNIFKKQGDKKNFKTSYVTVNQAMAPAIQGITKFQNILCYG